VDASVVVGGVSAPRVHGCGRFIVQNLVSLSGM
jgi:hypothetical protein